jgi:hypothetical protein
MFLSPVTVPEPVNITSRGLKIKPDFDGRIRRLWLMPPR